MVYRDAIKKIQRSLLCPILLALLGPLATACAAEADESSVAESAAPLRLPPDPVPAMVPLPGAIPSPTPVLGASRRGFLFAAMAKTVFGNMVDRVLTSEGEWTHTETYDTVSLGTRTVFEVAGQLHNPQLEARAMSAVEWYVDVVKEVAAKLAQGDTPDDESMSIALAGMPVLIDAYVHTGQARYRTVLGSLLGAFSLLIVAFPEQAIGPGGRFETTIYDPMYLVGSLITVNAELAMAVKKVRGFYDASARTHLRQARALIDAIDRLYRPGSQRFYSWAGTADPACASGSIQASLNSVPVMALASYYVATADAGVPDSAIRDQAVRLLGALEAVWDSSRGAYTECVGNDYVGLAENNTILYGALLLRDRRAMPGLTYVLKAIAFYSFVERDLLRTPPQDGYQVMLHDSQDVRFYWCSGCNMHAVYNIILLNRILGRRLPVDFYP